MSAVSEYLQSVAANQAVMQSPVSDVYALQTRYIFFPFCEKDAKELTLLQMQNLGGMPEFMAGCIIPISKYRMQDLDYTEIQRVPRDIEGNYQPVNEGVSAQKLVERTPSEVVNAIYEIFNRHHGTDATQDNGLCEIEVLRGNDELLRDGSRGLLELNSFCLPKRYKTAREQIGQLEKAVREADSNLFGSVASRLLASTLQAQAWANWHYESLEAAMEDRERSGKRRLSPLDSAVCKWIERDPPRFRTNLATGTAQAQQVVATLSRPTIQCENCGADANLLPSGQPPKFCGVCREPFVVVEEETELSMTLSDEFDPNNPMGEKETESAKKQRLAAEQARMRDKLKNQRNGGN